MKLLKRIDGKGNRVLDFHQNIIEVYSGDFQIDDKTGYRFCFVDRNDIPKPAIIDSVGVLWISVCRINDCPIGLFLGADNTIEKLKKEFSAVDFSKISFQKNN